MKFSTTIAFLGLALVDPLGVSATFPQGNDNCWDARPIYCGDTFAGQTTLLAEPDDYAVVGTCWDSGETPEGVWYKFSTGSDKFELSLDACDVQFLGLLGDVTVSVYTVGDTATNYLGCANHTQNLKCLESEINAPTCKWKNWVGPGSEYEGEVLEDEDYWILVSGKPGKPIDLFKLKATCDAAPLAPADSPANNPTFNDPSNPLAPIDHWFIQRTPIPPASVESIKPFEAAVFLELHPGQYVEPEFPYLHGEVYTVGTDPEEPCNSGTLVGGVVFTPTLCTDCDAQNEGIIVEHGFTIESPFAFNMDPDMTPIIWYPDDNEIRFCVHSTLKLDYNDKHPEVETVSYFDSFFVIKLDFTAEFMVGLKTFERNPENIEDLFDDFNAVGYLCEDGAIPDTTPFAPLDEVFLVGEKFQICVVPGDEYADDFKVVKWIDLNCVNEGENRMLIMTGDVIEPDILTEIVPPPDDGDYTHALAVRSTITAKWIGEPSVNGQNTVKCTGSVELGPKGNDRRALQEGEEELEPVTGVIQVEITLIQPPKEGLSVGAIVGISVGALAIFIVVLFILYRRGCFDKKKKRKHHPKTISVDESSETTGSKDGENL